MIKRIIPVPLSFQPQSRAYELKARLDWGEPALTIIDVRDREAFHKSHIRGAVSMPNAELVNRAQASLSVDRDIYMYSDSDGETALAANKLRQAGFAKVSELRGGLAAWKAFGYPIESTRSSRS
jgi:rhodanese-related sulfurtransferase